MGRIFASDESAAIVLDLLPLSGTVFLATVFGVNHLLNRRAFRLSRRASLGVLVVVFGLFAPLSVGYIFFEPPDALSASPGPWEKCTPSPKNRPLLQVKIISYADGKARPLGEVSRRSNRLRQPL